MRLRIFTLLACVLLFGNAIVGTAGNAVGTNAYYDNLSVADKKTHTDNMDLQMNQHLLPSGYVVPPSNPCKFMSESLNGETEKFNKVKGIMVDYADITLQQKLATHSERLNGMTEADHAVLRIFKDEYDVQTFSDTVITTECSSFMQGVFIALGTESQLNFYSNGQPVPALVVDSAGVQKNPLLGLAVLLTMTGMSHISSQF